MNIFEIAEVVELVDAVQDAQVSRRTGRPRATTLTGRQASHSLKPEYNFTRNKFAEVVELVDTLS